MVVSVDDGFNLSDIIRDFKKYTSIQIIKAIKAEPESRREWMLKYFATAAAEHSKTKNYKVWQDGNHPIELYHEKFTWRKIQYIHKNPVKAGIVTNC